MVADTINIIANLLIVCGYVLVPFLWLPYLPLTRPVLVSGTVFFLTCAFTHLSMALGFVHRPWMVINHVVQAAAVFGFVIGFSRLLRRATALRDDRPTKHDLRIASDRAVDNDDAQF